MAFVGYSRAIRCIVLIVFILAPLESLASATANDKKVPKEIKRYAEKIERAEKKSCNAQPGKSAAKRYRICNRDVSALDKRYDHLPGDIKADPQMIRLRKRHESLKKIVKELEHQAALEEISRNYRRHIERMETRTCRKADRYGANLRWLCAEDVLTADRIKERIPPDIREEPVIRDLVERHEKIRGMPAHMDKVMADANRDYLAAVRLKTDFKNDVHDIGCWAYLEAGKADKPGRIDDVKRVDKQMPSIRRFAADCKGKYAEYVRQHPRHQTKCELAENAQRYRDQFAAASYTVFLGTEIDEIHTIILRLENDNCIEATGHNRLVNGSQAYLRDVETQVSESRMTVGLPEPSYSDLEAAVAKLPAKIKAAADKNRWADKKTAAVSVPVKRLTIQEVEKMGMTLVKVGRSDEPWTLVKNQLGIPLHKTTTGWVMMKNPKDSFCRMQHASFTRTYDGTGYAPVSAVSIDSAIFPTRCE